MVWLDPSFHGLLNVKVEDPDIEYVPSRIVFEESLKHITVLRLFSVSVIPEADTTTWALSPTFVDGLAETELGTDGGWFVPPDETPTCSSGACVCTSTSCGGGKTCNLVGQCVSSGGTNQPPSVPSSVSASPSTNVGLSAQVVVSASGITDTENNLRTVICFRDSSKTILDGTYSISGSSTFTFSNPWNDGSSHTIYCFGWDGISYSTSFATTNIDVQSGGTTCSTTNGGCTLSVGTGETTVTTGNSFCASGTCVTCQSGYTWSGSDCTSGGTGNLIIYTISSLSNSGALIGNQIILTATIKNTGASSASGTVTASSNGTGLCTVSSTSNTITN